MSSPRIRTRLLIISDTHGAALFDPEAQASPADPPTARPQQRGFRRPLPRADVAIHCGDLTFNSEPAEFEVTFGVMREIDAPLKLVIPGNHDGSLDERFWEEHCEAQEPHLPAAALAALRRAPAASRAIVQRARRDDGVHVLLDEGTYHFVLASGVRLTVYASPWTPAYGHWGFQYDADADAGGVEAPEALEAHHHHRFCIEPGTDVAMTHGPPYAVLDTTRTGDRAGCRILRRSVRAARPRLHCFGHIHEAAGYAVSRWEEEDGEEDEGEQGRGVVVEEVEENVSADEGGGLRKLSLCGGDRDHLGLEEGRQTLFVNAAVMDVSYRPYQSPWLVDIELPLPDEEHRKKAEETQKRLLAMANPVEGP